MASFLFRLQLLVCAKVISEDRHVCEVALRIIEEGFQVGVHGLLVQVVIDVLLFPRVTPGDVCLLLCLHVLPP